MSEHDLPAEMSKSPKRQLEVSRRDLAGAFSNAAGRLKKAPRFGRGRLKKWPHTRSLEFLNILAKFRGSISGLKYAEALKHPGDFSSKTTDFFAEDANINVVHPFNQLTGSNAYLEEFVLPLQDSFKGLYRRDDIFMLGEFEGQEWISSTGYYVGKFEKDWIGLRATKKLSYLRYGEFHRIENGYAVESYIYLDIPELMISCNQ